MRAALELGRWTFPPRNLNSQQPTLGAARGSPHIQLTARAAPTSNYVHCGYTHPVKTEAESLLPLPPATFHILVALADEDRHGYAVIKDVAARTGGTLKLSAGTLYRSVDRMVQQGLIREISSRPGERHGRRAPALLPDYAVRPRRRDGRSAPAGADARPRTGEGARASEGVMRIYRLLLHLYPASFRADYGEEMAAIFQAQLRAARGVARLTLWFAAFHEVIMNAPAAHWDILKQDLRYTARTLNRARGFALTAILVTALGVGANTAAFSVADFVLLRPLPFADPDAPGPAVRRTARGRADGAA